MYTDTEMVKEILKGLVLSSVIDYIEGRVIIKTGKTINYYCRESASSWTNYDCKTEG